jgi:hypothetical protein
MYHHALLKLIGITEIAIGLCTLSGIAITPIADFPQKHLSVMIFVIVTSIISVFLGIGIIKNNKMAIKLILIFSIYIILTKIFIFLGLMQFNGEIISFISRNTKNYISLIYHCLLVFVFYRELLTPHT